MRFTKGNDKISAKNKWRLPVCIENAFPHAPAHRCSQSDDEFDTQRTVSSSYEALQTK